MFVLNESWQIKNYGQHLIHVPCFSLNESNLFLSLGFRMEKEKRQKLEEKERIEEVNDEVQEQPSINDCLNLVQP